MRSDQSSPRTLAEVARRRQMIGCAIEMIADAGYSQASLAKIGERSGIAESAVPYHFPLSVPGIRSYVPRGSCAAKLDAGFRTAAAGVECRSAGDDRGGVAVDIVGNLSHRARMTPA